LFLISHNSQDKNLSLEKGDLVSYAS
jgi:hypothetical protein